ncbi:MAG: methyltransferase [Bacteroidales bacterium]|nr:methyltransferase [Bacteroidales bacterium]
MEFRCKQFSLNHSNSSMKIGTDAVILSSYVSETLKANTVKSVLDIGTGCGIIALCMAQTFDKAKITAIDIDEKSIKEAEYNFTNNAFFDRMDALCMSVQDFADKTCLKFDLIISNPPFFTSSLQSPDIRRTNARHNITLSLEDLAKATFELLSDKGFIAVILPEKEIDELTSLYRSYNILPVYVMNVYSKPHTPVKRRICIYGRSGNEHISQPSQTLYIRVADNEYSKYYKHLTSEFLL